MNNCLFISDMHMPYHHKDSLPFLEAVSSAYAIEEVKNVGDLIDNHGSSFHPIEYGTMSTKEEHEAAYKGVQQLYEMFPEMVITLGNHCSMTHRKAKEAGIPIDHIKSYNDIYNTPGWKWTDRDYFKIDKYNHCLMVHGMSKSTLSNAKSHSHCSVQGHFHGTYGLEYFADTEVMRWSMSVGCLIDHSSPAFNYSKGYTNNKPIIGVGAIIEDRPLLIPMRLKKNGRWDNTV